MFTGIIQHVGKIVRAYPSDGGLRLEIDAGPLAKDLPRGGSIAVNGACLTAREEPSRSRVIVDVVAETVEKTTIGSLRAGQSVNLERPLRLNDMLDGHLLQGHVDGTARVKTIKTSQRIEIIFNSAAQLISQMVPKGSVAIDGVSLTLVDVSPLGKGEGTFSVALIPTTLAETTLNELKAGSQVNIETDIIGKYVMKHIRSLTMDAKNAHSAGGGLTLEKLRDSGFA